MDQEAEVVDLEEEEEWEDLDAGKEKAAEIERKKRILKGQLARAVAREREPNQNLPEDCMSRKESGDPVGAQRQTRRSSIGKPPTKTPAGIKRKITSEEAPQKGRRMSSGAQGSAGASTLSLIHI